MRRKGLRIAATAFVMTLTMCMTALASGWQKDTTGWSWQKEDGTYYSNGWQWIDGNGDGTAECYYFDSNGYMLSSTATPDGYEVNADGVWVLNGVIQTTVIAQQPAQNSQTAAPEIDGLYYDSNWGANYYLRTLEDGSLQVLLSDAAGTQGDVYMTMAYEGGNSWSDGTDPVLANRAWVTETGVHISMFGYMQRELVKATPQ